jgi:hypothetical protein
MSFEGPLRGAIERGMVGPSGRNASPVRVARATRGMTAPIASCPNCDREDALSAVRKSSRRPSSPKVINAVENDRPEAAREYAGALQDAAWALEHVRESEREAEE